MGNDPEGAISRFLEDGLHVLLWRRHPEIPGTVLWTELDLDVIKSDFAGIVRQVGDANPNPEISLVLLDNNSQVVAQTVPGFSADWRKPFVASEVGEILPHWEVAAYLLDPDAVNRSANLAKLMLRLLVPGLLIAIGLGAVLIFFEIGREMRLARQKTDFVSNVSHELKTPLTSIRMFSDLLSTPREVEPTKRTEYSGIISREAARLTRLINNLLDFSRLERNEKQYHFEDLDAVSLARETVDNYRHQFEADGIALHFHDLAGGPVPIRGDRDSLSQVILNLLSNAEKYGGPGGEIDVEVSAGGDSAEIRILDRGTGIARKHAAKVFEKFFRVDDSLSSGIEGSGLGLTLARQIARSHGGDVTYRPRDGGGSCFALELPVNPEC
jgi:signal transduction histidine kinase